MENNSILLSFSLSRFKAFENAVSIMYALGGSTNGVLHLLALAHELVQIIILLPFLSFSLSLFPSSFLRAGVDLSIDEFNGIADKIPLLANLKPHGKVKKI